ncbi:unnamed protein product [Leuciscus chuanchicus]
MFQTPYLLKLGENIVVPALVKVIEIELFSGDLAFGPLLLSPVTTVLTRLAKVFPGWPIRGRQCQGSPLSTPTPLGVRGSAVWWEGAPIRQRAERKKESACGVLFIFARGELQKSCSRTTAALLEGSCQLPCQCRPYPPLPPPPPPPPPPRLLAPTGE